MTAMKAVRLASLVTAINVLVASGLLSPSSNSSWCICFTDARRVRGARGATVKVRPGAGVIKIRTTTLNQHDEAVLVHALNLVVPRRKDIREQQRL
jgi:hypothetical protein